MPNPPRTVLVVDDDDTLLRLVARVIARAGDRVLTASSGEAARALFEEHQDSVDIVVLDVSLPGGEGAQTLMPDMLAARPTLRVIVMSGALLPSPLALEVERIVCQRHAWHLDTWGGQFWDLLNQVVADRDFVW